MGAFGVAGAGFVPRCGRAPPLCSLCVSAGGVFANRGVVTLFHTTERSVDLWLLPSEVGRKNEEES